MKGTSRLTLVSVAIFVFVCTAVAQPGGPPPPRIEKMLNFGNVAYGMLLEGTTTDGTDLTENGQKVSGTNVEIKVTVGSGYVEAPPGSSPNITRVTVSDIQIYILGTEGADDVLPGMSPPFGTIAGGVGEYRFSSTFFEHLDEIKIRAVATFTFYHDGTSTVKPYDDYIGLTAYNYMQSAGTDVDVNGSIDYTIKDISEKTVGHIQTYGQNYMNHGVNPTSVFAAMNQSASSIHDLTKNATAMLLMLHGNPTELADSHAYNTVYSSIIASKVQSKLADKIPAFNLVAMWSCDTLDITGIGWTEAYSIAVPDRGYIGYAETINAQCWTEEEWDEAADQGHSDPEEADIPFSRDVSHNAEILLDHLSGGATLGVSRMIVHNQVPMVRSTGFGWDKVYSYVNGDPLMRMRYVYLRTAERNALQLLGRSVDVPLIKIPIQ